MQTVSLTLKEPLFLGVNFNNVKTKDAKPPTISVRVNLQHDDLIYAASIKSRMEVVGYEDPVTSLFVTQVEGVEGQSVYHTFRMKAVKYAKEELELFIDHLSSLDDEAYKQAGYKNRDLLINLLTKCLVDRQELYADLQKQINLITSRKLPRVNEFLFFADDETSLSPVTTRVPYKNPKNAILTDEQRQIVNKYLDVFLDEYNKRILAWYLGAALLNVPLYDDRVSKLMVVSSSYGGSGKSTLINTLVDALFTPAYREIKDDFDSFFAITNKFGISSLSYKRMSVYSEAKFRYNTDPTSKEHNFQGMNVSVLKSLITEGYVSSEAKFGDRAMDRLSGFHMVLTNHPPVITQENEALNRRILPLMIRPTKMTEKAQELNLWGKRKLESFVFKHVDLFAAYFAETFLADEYAFADLDYDHNDYVLDITEAQEDLDVKSKTSRQKLEVLKSQGIIRVITEIGEQTRLNVQPLINDIIQCTSSDGSDEINTHIRLENNILWFDSSKTFLLRYGNYGNLLRKQLKDLYGPPEKRFQKRMFMIPFNDVN